MYTRNCPNCKKELTYKSKRNRDKADGKIQCCLSCAAKVTQNRPDHKKRMGELRSKKYTGSGNPFFGRKHTDATKEKIRQSDHSIHKTPEFRAKMSSVTSGSKNPMFAKRLVDVWLSKYGEIETQKKIEALSRQRSINSAGSKNSMYGKPPPKGSGNGWSGWYKGWYFRSLRELSYLLYEIEDKGYEWESAEKKAYAIEYINHLGARRTYRADFLVSGRVLVEVKPQKLMNTLVNRCKQEAALKFCERMGWEYKMVDVELLKPSILLDMCHSGAVKLHADKLVILEKKYGNR